MFVFELSLILAIGMFSLLLAVSGGVYRWISAARRPISVPAARRTVFAQ